MEQSKDDGVIAALLERFKNQRLPRILQLKEKVDSGEKLNDFDMSFLEEVLKGAHEIVPIADRHPEYQDLMAKAIRLHHDITEEDQEAVVYEMNKIIRG